MGRSQSTLFNSSEYSFIFYWAATGETEVVTCRNDGRRSNQEGGFVTETPLSDTEAAAEARIILEKFFTLAMDRKDSDGNVPSDLWFVGALSENGNLVLRPEFFPQVFSSAADLEILYEAGDEFWVVLKQPFAEEKFLWIAITANNAAAALAKCLEFMHENYSVDCRVIGVFLDSELILSPQNLPQSGSAY